MNKYQTLIAHSTVAVLVVVVMAIISHLLPQAHEVNRPFLVFSEWFFMALLLVQAVNIVSEVRSKL